jgi:hypothetical protein
MYFDLSSLLHIIDNLHILEEPISHEEINGIMKNLPSEKSPGPDGFNSEFMKRCWTTISADFYDICLAFYDHNINIQSINGSYITLIPKNSNPTRVNDYIPISLLNTSIKFINKALADRLQTVILKVIHQNQYGFIKSRTIQDCLGWAFQYIHLYHKSKKELVIIKLDFEKAFDKIEHEVILQVMSHKGFGQKWNQWTKDILSSGTFAILLNGVPSKVFHCRREGGGVRQGDPLCPSFLYSL